jgi:NTE family protein
MAEGYRFPRIDGPGATSRSPLDERRQALERADRIFIVLTFSGGGTRAGALAYGVLRQLDAIRLHVSSDGDLVDCPDWESAACKQLERRLLDEVDVISSVSGGSFTSAYYALKGDEIFSSDSAFHRRFLFHNVQRDLFGSAVYHPRSWPHLGSRVEIASRYYQQHIFGKATFNALADRPRPFVIINADDMSTGNRFEFTQDQFDLLCADLGPFTIARAVTASSAFPGLLNSMTVDSYNGPNPARSPCGYAGPGSPDADEGAKWVDDVLENKAVNRRRYRAALALKSYRDATRRHLHLLDGGLADNIGLRTVLSSVSSADRLSAPSSDDTKLNADAGRLIGGWSLQQLINDGRIRTLIVVAVNARTEKTKEWDAHARGPSTLAVLGATRGTPMGNFSHETVDLIQEETTRLAVDQKAAGKTPPDVFTFEVAFDDIDDDAERAYFLNLPTTFGLAREQVTCLTDRAPVLLRGARVLNWDPVIAPEGPPTFSEVVARSFFGRIGVPPITGNPSVCRLGGSPQVQ